MLTLLLLTVLAAYQSHAATSNYYTAAVVELATPVYPNYTADEVMVANAVLFDEYIMNASLSKADIIVFPEGGLLGQNVRKAIRLPSPAEKANPCKEASRDYHKALVLLSCSAFKYNMYVVINTGEEFFNITTNKTEYYNSNVAFDRNGTVVARYRKFNPYGESVNKPVLDLHTFDTDFNVTFGMFICFDIDFMEPGVVLARDLGVKHFAFPHCWISELPFLTAIQAQWGFAYSLDTVLLASGCNAPARGGTGSGIYHGRRGALQYFQTNDHTSRLIIANVSKSFEPSNKAASSRKHSGTVRYNEPARNVLPGDHGDLEIRLLNDRPTDFWTTDQPSSGRSTDHLQDDQPTNSSLFLLRDYTDVYKSQTLFPTGYSTTVPAWKNSSLSVTLTTETTVCQGDLCCDFRVKVTSSFNASLPKPTSRGDDFSQQHYRLVAFDGVRWYGGGIATGGVQICGVISCVNDSISSCGLRSDDPAARVATYGQLYKVGTVFESISITGSFSYNKTFLYPDILTTASGDNFGALVSSDIFTYDAFPPHNGSVIASLTLDVPIPNLVTAAIYARQFDRDGEKRTELPTASFAHPLPHSLFMFCVLFLFFFNCIFSWMN